MGRIEVDDEQIGSGRGGGDLGFGQRWDDNRVTSRREFPQGGTEGDRQGIVFLNEDNPAGCADGSWGT
jgi:hypothetical protein